MGKRAVDRVCARPRPGGGASVPEESAFAGPQSAAVRTLQTAATCRQEPPPAAEGHQLHRAGGARRRHGNSSSKRRASHEHVTVKSGDICEHPTEGAAEPPGRRDSLAEVESAGRTHTLHTTTARHTHTHQQAAHAQPTAAAAATGPAERQAETRGTCTILVRTETPTTRMKRVDPLF